MDAWLEEAAARLAAAAGDDPAGYALGDSDETELLDLARVAAHASGARTNAPLLAYLVGLARGRHPERPLAELAAAAARDDTRR